MLMSSDIYVQSFKQKVAGRFWQNFKHLSKQDVIVGLVLSSLMINVLGLILPFTIIQMYDRVIPNKSYNTFVAFILIVIVGLIVEAILKIMRGFVSTSLDVKLGYSMSLYAYKTAINSDLIEFERNPFSVQIDRFNLINTLKEYYSGQYFIVMCDAPFVLIYFIFVYCIQVYVGIGITVVSLMLLAISYLHAFKFKVNQLQKTKNTQIVSKFLVELLSGISTVKTIGLEEQMLRRYERLQKHHVQKEFDLVQERMASSKNIAIVGQLMIMVTVIIGCYMIFKEHMTMGGMAACILLSGKVMQPIANLMSLLLRLQNFEVADREFNKLISVKSENNAAQKTNIIQGEIVLDNINFSHTDQNGNKIPIFVNTKIQIPPKQMIAISGDKLSGKSTLIQILACLYKVDSGNFFIDGQDVNLSNLDYIRNQIAFISQESYCFQGTILDNLTRFCDLDLEKVEKCCLDIGLHQIVQTLPNGYQTIIGIDANDVLTQNIKQYIMIARELIKDPKIILFDELNTNTDLETDMVLHNIINLQKGKATIIVASYRQSLLKLADQHYFIKERNLIRV